MLIQVTLLLKPLKPKRKPIVVVEKLYQPTLRQAIKTAIVNAKDRVASSRKIVGCPIAKRVYE